MIVWHTTQDGANLCSKVVTILCVVPIFKKAHTITGIEVVKVQRKSEKGHFGKSRVGKTRERKEEDRVGALGGWPS